jgi:hypothetical protein
MARGMTYELSESVRAAVGELVNRGYTVRPTGWWFPPLKHRGDSRGVASFEVVAPNGLVARCFPSDLLLVGEYRDVASEREAPS